MTRQRIIDKIRSQGMTQSYVAEMMGISRQALHDRLCREPISSRTLTAIAEVIGVSVAELYGATSEERVAALERENDLLRTIIEEKERYIEELLRK